MNDKNIRWPFDSLPAWLLLFALQVRYCWNIPEQFVKYGIREISIQKLIEPMGISTKTVYKYYKNKEELLEAAMLLFHAQQYGKLEKLLVGKNAAAQFYDIWYMAVEAENKVNKLLFQDLHYS